MAEQRFPHLPWLNQLTMSVPGYGGYQARGQRRSAAFALRDVLLQRLTIVNAKIDQALKSCRDHDVTRECAALERTATHLERISERVRGFGARSETFYDEAPDIEHTELESVYAKDHAILEQADLLSSRFDQPNLDHNMLANVERDLKALEQKLDERALALRSVV